MSRRLSGAAICAVIVLAAGCSPVQKGATTGGALGGATGAAIGHYASSLGGVPGGLIGMTVGAAGGALAADHYYNDPADDAETQVASGDLQRLRQQLGVKDEELAKTEAQLEKERAQQKAILEAYEKLRSGKGALQSTVPAGVQVSTDVANNTITYTVLSEVLFDSGRADLRTEGKSTLRQAAQHIREEFPNAEIEVRGHTDNVPIRYSSYESNWDLSCARAVSVVRYLIEAESFTPDKLVAVGCGETRPVAPNSNASGRRKNRRAEIVVRPVKVEVADVRTSE